MGLFKKYNTLEKAKKVYEDARKGKVKVHGDVESVRALADNDKLFIYALTDDVEVSAAAISAITDPLAIHRLIELETGRPDLLAACLINPSRSKDDLGRIFSVCLKQQKSTVKP